MPAPTIEKLEQRAQELRQRYAGLGEDAEPAKRRRTRKKLKRAQRRWRKTRAAEERIRKAASKPADEAASS